MRANSPYHYHLLVQDRQLGPYTRATIVGMCVKKLVDKTAPVQRSDGHRMSVEQLVADRFEMADAESSDIQNASPPASGIWPTFLIDCKGSLFKPGAFDFIGRGELRFQGDCLRITGNRKSGMVSTRQERIKLPLKAVRSAKADATHSNELVLELTMADQVLYHGHPDGDRVKLDDAEAVRELLELMNLS